MSSATPYSRACGTPQDDQVKGYEGDSAKAVDVRGSWNGRVILTLGDTWIGLEEPMAGLRNQCLGACNTDATTFQENLTDVRPHLASDKPTDKI